MKSRRIAFASGRVSSTPFRPTAVWKNCPSARASSRATSTRARASLAICPPVAVAMSLEVCTDSRFTLFIVIAEIAAMTSTAIADVSTISLVPIFILLKVPLMFCLRLSSLVGFHLYRAGTVHPAHRHPPGPWRPSCLDAILEALRVRGHQRIS